MYDLKNIKKVLFTKEQINERIKQVANQVKQYYLDHPPVNGPLITVGLLKGCVIFNTEFVLNFDYPIQMDFMAVSSYNGMQSTGAIKIKLDTSLDLTNRDVLIVEDMVDTGLTLSKVKEHIIYKGANSVKVVTLVDKKDFHTVDFTPDWNCFNIDDYYIVGYGFDCNEDYRNLPYIALYQPDNN
ncbi:hypoxanthine phosphoribosyltransferase [Mycoplasma mycoides]|uniref:hypoxanthine phosphoribosyltransferase n=1 Tax=Mycoplasma mycoides TaxID=2102 RepID=UPI001AFB93CD|nr:hypoxanthine phosphoribosyltransferase [Mycoplasma mycoides]QQY78102.1 hypoxanthine phosphoribosyltransferase [Mycoplasma mycoides subsp. capri]MDP4040542.1 hypoxanthine phosphoribosyltransferase [Mycoplasma mycoides]MDP4041331.1 hypoxanthine phosphoribosyltransferase [Mycoplasma mycoides]MDP4042323.1 hypoxanthine phosphoribosyltransferase [Mycoplasma mycoides]MDP4043725.1 hypoxanthine phosphoribosyltransferase [Mycoplasma mycoides]